MLDFDTSILEILFTYLAIASIVIWLVINRGRHTLGARWFGLAALLLCLSLGLGQIRTGPWNYGTASICGILFGTALLSFCVPEKASPKGKERPTPWCFWRQGEWEKAYTTPYRPYVDGKPPVPWAIRHQQALRRGETPPPPPWEEKK